MGQQTLDRPRRLVLHHAVGVDHVFVSGTLVERRVAARCVVEPDHFHVDDVGDLDAIPQNRLHKRAIVLEHRRLTG